MMMMMKKKKKKMMMMMMLTLVFVMLLWQCVSELSSTVKEQESAIGGLNQSLQVSNKEVARLEAHAKQLQQVGGQGG
jgi:uncharacterized protein YoxC